MLRKATRLSGLALMESMRSTAPGLKEYELTRSLSTSISATGARSLHR
jgi:hypothetical protein